MDAVDAMKDTVDPELEFGTTFKRIHYDEKSDALYATNGHLLFVLPKRDLQEQPISQEDRDLGQLSVAKPLQANSKTCKQSLPNGLRTWRSGRNG
jgi:cupin superfamily acireductone dioxygenase involved in methionine salvage